MKAYVKKFFGSRRVGLVLLGLAVFLLNKYVGLGLTEDELKAMAGIDIAGIMALGLGDFGKEAKALEAKAPAVEG